MARETERQRDRERETGDREERGKRKEGGERETGDRTRTHTYSMRVERERKDRSRSQTSFENACVCINPSSSSGGQPVFARGLSAHAHIHHLVPSVSARVQEETEVLSEESRREGRQGDCWPGLPVFGRSHRQPPS